MERSALRRRIAAFALAACVAAASAACITYDKIGPLFAPSAAPADGYALVYVYRPAKAWGAAHAYGLGQEERTVVLFAGAYAVLVVPDGKGTFDSMGKPFAYEASHAKPTYIRAEFDSLVDSWNEFKGANWKLTVVGEAEALAELAEIPLAPGGRARYVGGAAPSASASATATPSASALAGPAPTATASTPPAADPTVDTIYMKDGTTIVGEIIDEDPKSISIMLKDGHGRAIPKASVDHVSRREKKK